MTLPKGRTPRPSAIGGYEDWPGAWRAGPVLRGDRLTDELAGIFGVLRAAPVQPHVVDRWHREGLDFTELEWNTGFGPTTHAWAIRPERSARERLPGVLALHCHAGVKHIGAERLLTTRQPSSSALRLRAQCYEGQALAERVARDGFVVLAHDTFAWGSRRFQLDPEPARLAAAMAAHRAAWRAEGRNPDAAEAYDVAAAHHEATVAKFAGVMGTSFAGAVAHDDVAALDVLAALPGVDSSRLAAIGFSGGGGRAAVVTALDPRIRASVVVCMMTTLGSLYPAYLDAHSWLLATPDLGLHHELTDIAFARGRHDQLVLYAADDDLFPPAGMVAADAELRRLFAGSPGSYVGIIVPGPHRFDRQMQDVATAFLGSALHG